MIVMTAATRQEIDAISRCLGKKQPVTDHEGTAWRSTWKCKEVLTVRTGIGRGMVERVIDPVLASYPVEAIISLGFGGALTEELGAGDLVVCRSVVSRDKTDAPCPADEYLLERAISALNGKTLKCIRGSSVTVSKVVSTVDEKRALRVGFGAEVCQMEDYWVARAARARQIPFLAVRVIYDELNARLPDYDRMVDRYGNLRPGGIAFLITNPGQLFNAWSLYRNYRRAKESLSAFVEWFLDVI